MQAQAHRATTYDAATVMADPDDTPLPIPIEPELDLHAFHPRDIPAVVDEFVTAAHAAGLTELRLVHGRGKGVQRGIVQAALERHPLVTAFWDDTRAHLGATIARLQPAPLLDDGL
jgi:dsDNA-specific endonuclease/ATPase MutS2